ncbi:hypothetical protein BX070DRAFT_141169 [Coemansia spiralis]|nr:hypothetical protein BX070DRAFT_141169 [Coemansia spiralis]
MHFCSDFLLSILLCESFDFIYLLYIFSAKLCLSHSLIVMPAYATFQMLPLHIVYSTGWYLFESHRYRLGQIHIMAYNTLSHLYDSSRIWHNMACGYLFKGAVLRIPDGKYACIWNFGNTW